MPLLVEIPRPRNVPNLLLIAATKHHHRTETEVPYSAILDEIGNDLETEAGDILFTDQRIIEYMLSTESGLDLFTQDSQQIDLESNVVLLDITNEAGVDLFTELSQQFTTEG